MCLLQIMEQACGEDGVKKKNCHALSCLANTFFLTAWSRKTSFNLVHFCSYIKIHNIVVFSLFFFSFFVYVNNLNIDYCKG